MANEGDGVSVIETAHSKLIEVPDTNHQIRVGAKPSAIAVSPDQPPLASFSASVGRTGVPVDLNASTSGDPDSPIATYAWDFGDGHEMSSTVANVNHVFEKPGVYRVSLKETDAEGCSTLDTFRFAGQTAYCNGGASALTSKMITVAPPFVSPVVANHSIQVRVRCPKSTKSKSCAFSLQAISKKPARGKRPLFESTLAKASAKPGRSTLVSLHPKSAFDAKLSTARAILLKEAIVTGDLHKVRYVRLKVEQ